MTKKEKNKIVYACSEITILYKLFMLFFYKQLSGSDYIVGVKIIQLVSLMLAYQMYRHICTVAKIAMIIGRVCTQTRSYFIWAKPSATLTNQFVGSCISKKLKSWYFHLKSLNDAQKELKVEPSPAAKAKFIRFFCVPSLYPIIVKVETDWIAKYI